MDLTNVTWRKSTYSGGDNACVEVAQVAMRKTDTERIFVLRDSKNPDGPRLHLTHAAWNAFRVGIKSGDFDHLTSE
ncbi:DUF397 domain-containing protein [Thermopolyspora sp. NPDC052614]|uniref:DUF397 domain-containing protein n=1 Tax=Thermopolyspora sp. NPDC052614 TaxID=3155682 RepID=UPI0034345741